MLCTVVTASRSLGIGDGLTYESGDLAVQAGSLVEVPLRGKMAEGIVIAVNVAHPGGDFAVKAIKRVIGTEPVINAFQLQTAQWMAEHYCCSLRAALAPFLPSPPWIQLLPRETVGYRLAPGEHHVRGDKQQHVIDQLQPKGWLSRQEMMRDMGVSTATISGLVKKGVLIEERVRDENDIAPARYDVEVEPTLIPQQEAVYKALQSDSRPALLFGVTGSGKTHVYAKLIADMARAGKQSILLVPEILLTEHIIHYFQDLFAPERIAVIHSRLTDAARRDEWRRIRSGEAALIIGSRSALFAPCRNLGLVLIDEEHEWTYKNEQSPRYHAREAAETLCRFSGARLVLGSATPSLESWHRAKSGRYHLLRLPERFSGLQPPIVRVVDLGSVRFGEAYPFSPPLLDAIQQRLEKGEQSVLFLNRRGMATALLCLHCRRRLMSPESQVPFTVHRRGDGRPFLLDHLSGVSIEVPAVCPSCKSPSLRAIGAGTQRLEDLIARLFPSARILRADADTLKHPEQMRLLLKKMREKQADILCGTQSVVKGLDLPNVTLAAVLIADIGLSLPHFRAGERVFQLLSQLTGRSGRALPGEVIIQTFRPDSVEVKAAALHETERYLEEELQLRTQAKYPPDSNMIRLIIAGKDAMVRAQTLHKEIQKRIAAESLPIIAMCAPTLTGAGKVWHILLRGPSPRDILPGLALDEIVIDVDPIECV